MLTALYIKRLEIDNREVEVDHSMHSKKPDMVS
jgi:hypothetical protein